MKELSIEEKAKRYDEALKEAVIAHKDEDRHLKATLDGIFPELKESENERIRKALIEMVHDTTGDALWVDYNVHKEECIAWLEKQAEHANFRNKIQIGDKVTRNKDGVLVNLSQLNRVAKKDEKQGEQKPAWSEEDEAKLRSILFHIEDVENKDVIDWLKCLKDRYTWKPSDEQMDMLKIAVSTSNSIVLDSLYNDLMKLKE